MEIVIFLIGLALGVGLGVGSLYFYQNKQGKGRLHQAETEASQIIGEAQSQAKQITVDAKDQALSTQREAENNAKKRRTELDRESDRLHKRREDLDARYERLDQREQTLNKRQGKIDRRQNEIDAMYDEQKTLLGRMAEMTREEARAELLTLVEKDSRQAMARRIREIEEETKLEADHRARDILSLAIQRIASEHVNEISVSVVPLPSDEMKGRIIGRNGRNIRSFEQAAGVDVVVDDTPGAVTISCFDPVRREIAKRSMAKLVLDGRIHPARIEKLVSDAQKEVDIVIREEGERAAYEAGVPGLHNEIIKLLGRLKFRTSYGQNQLSHAIESAHIAGMIAAELGADVALAKAGGLLHDLGKAIDHDIEGTHAQIGADFVKRYGASKKIINCIAAHHHEVEPECVEALIVEASDAISGARPGARRENLDTYIRRIKALEDIAREFEGVDQSYALQAGREVRIMVKPEAIDDLAAAHLARDIAKRIEETMQYPGQIKVTIIRETRVVGVAK